MKKLISCFVILFAASVLAFAQSSGQLSEILESEKASFAQASYLPAIYTNLINENSSPEEAFTALSDNDYFKASVDSEEPISLSQYCYICTKAFGIKGGLFFRLFDSPRYAFKEFKAQGILPVSADPSAYVSGRDVIDIFNSCLDIAEGEE